MLVKITTTFTLDPSTPHGRKNLNLLLIAAGLRSQIEVKSITAVDANWEVVLLLERPEYWGDDLEFLKHDLASLVIFHNSEPTDASLLLKLEPIV